MARNDRAQEGLGDARAGRSKKFKERQATNLVKGLCQKCYTSNMEVTIKSGIPMCAECIKSIEQAT